MKKKRPITEGADEEMRKFGEMVANSQERKLAKKRGDAAAASRGDLGRAQRRFSRWRQYATANVVSAGDECGAHNPLTRKPCPRVGYELLRHWRRLWSLCFQAEQCDSDFPQLLV